MGYLLAAAGAIFGWTQGGALGSLTGLLVPFLAVVALKLGRVRAPDGFVPAPLAATIMVISVCAAAFVGGWSFGWLWALASFVVASFIVQRINLVIAGKQWRAKNRPDVQ